MNSPLRTKAEILSIVAKIESGDPIMSPDELKGIVSRSLLLDIENFHCVFDLPGEYMHGTCLGLIKRLTELTFAVGENRYRVTKRKLTPPSKFNELMSKIKVTHEFPRRIRELDFAVMKAVEFRNLSLFYFPIIIGEFSYCLL